MHSTTLTGVTWHQGRYVNGAYDDNNYYISTDMLPIELGIQVLSFSNTGSQTIWLKEYHAATSQEPAYFDPPYQSTRCTLRVRLYDGTGTQISYEIISIGGEKEVPKKFMAQYAIIEIEGYEDSGAAYRYKLRPDEASCQYSSGFNDRTIAYSVEVGMQYVQWYIYDDGFPRNDDAELFPKDFSEPYPKAMWRITNGYNDGFPFNELMPDIPRATGAFRNADKLERVKIPISVKTIGAEAFKGTALQRVRIAADCTYGEQSFPAGCVVTRYPDDRYDQLYDCDGKAVLDCNAARIYVLKEELSNG